jgi:Mg-chelatase subunit ChlD
MSVAGKTLSASLVLLSAALLTQARSQEPAKKSAPKVEVVFCLDTTGSMVGLIEAAKQKIWAITNQISSGKPTPQVRIGLVAYRDRGRDEYITKIFDLTDDLDAIHGHLMGLRAAGGGDTPESVNQALHESVTKINWSKDKKTLRIIFLVGDAPPHMDYPDDVKYTETCKLAAGRDIIVNTVQCGNIPDTRKYWEDICRLAEGSYVQIDAKGGPVIHVATPFDKDLAKINEELARSTLVYGSREMQRSNAKRAAEAAALPAGAAADRAGFFARSESKGAAAFDLSKNIKDGKVKLEDLKKDELPPELQKLTLKEQKAYLEKLDKRREELSTQVLELDKKRSAFIAKKQAEDEKSRARDSFDNQVLNILRRQATRVNIEYADQEKKK